MDVIEWEYSLQVLALSLIEPGRDDKGAWEGAVEPLNEVGAEGWEAVAVLRTGVRLPNGEEAEPLVLMKRPRKPETLREMITRMPKA